MFIVSSVFCNIFTIGIKKPASELQYPLDSLICLLNHYISAIWSKRSYQICYAPSKSQRNCRIHQQLLNAFHRCPILFALSAISVTVRSAAFAVAAPSYSKTDKLLFLINFFLLNISHILFECCPLMHFFPSVLQYLLNSYLLYIS